MNLGNPVDFRLGARSPFQIEGWVCSEGGERCSATQIGSVEGEWSVLLGTNGILEFAREISPYNLYSTQTIPLGIFTHIAATYDGTSMKIFINGQLDA